MRLFRKPLCYLGGIFIGYVSFDVLVSFNPYLEIALGFEPFSGIIWIHFIDDFLQQSSLWAVFYLMEKNCHSLHHNPLSLPLRPWMHLSVQGDAERFDGPL